MWPLTGLEVLPGGGSQLGPPPWLHRTKGWSLTFPPHSRSLICYPQGPVKPSAAQDIVTILTLLFKQEA